MAQAGNIGHTSPELKKLEKAAQQKVEKVVIRQFETRTHEPGTLYRQLFEHDEQLALWLRRRAAYITDNLDEREKIMTLALELFAIQDNVKTIAELRQTLTS